MRLAWRAVFDFVPVPIVYVDALASGRGGEARGPLVRLRAKYRNNGDEGIHEHELEHVRQFWLAWLVSALICAPTAWALAAIMQAPLPAAWIAAGVAVVCAAVHPFLYLGVRVYRLTAEARAYRIQVATWPLRLTTAEAALMLADARRYRLGITLEDALDALR